MEGILELLVEHGYLVLVVWVLSDEGGMPIPAAPALVTAGVLAGTGSLNLGLVIILAVGATLAMNMLWYAIGIRHGGAVLKMLCRVSLEPDFCVRRTHHIFQRYGNASLLVSSFVPGLQTVAPPLAGATGVPFMTFVGVRFAGALLWVGAFTLPGYLFAQQAYVLLQRAADHADQIFIAVVAGIAAFVGYKFLHRQWFLRAVRTGIVEPADLHAELERGARPQIVDLRQRSELESFPYVIPNALFIPFEEMDDHVETLAQQRDIILYCT